MDTASQASGSQTRSSSGSVRPNRSTNPDKQISQIEKSVTHLLVATKQLLETLTQWSRGNSQEEEVSDVYVRLGYEFNLACRAFNSIGVETNDLGPVPDLLRSILEDTLSQPASPQALDNYLPRIRDIIINLLHGLKRKQSKLRSRPVKDGSSKSQPPAPAPARQGSVASVQSTEASLEAAFENTNTQTSDRSDSRLDSLRFTDEPQTGTTEQPRTTSLNRNSFSRPNQRHQPRQLQSSDSAPSLSSPAPQSIPQIHAPPESNNTLPSFDLRFPHAPPPPPKQDALTALQRGPDLERRASRRFSAYQIQKHLGASPNGIPVIPPAQNSPIPNRGREVKESLTAVRSRTSFQTKKSASRLREISPAVDDSFRAPQRISEEREEPPPSIQKETPTMLPDGSSGSYSPTVKTPEEYVGSDPAQPILSATLNGPLSPLGGFDQTKDSPSRIQTNAHFGDVVPPLESVEKLAADAQTDPRFATPSPTFIPHPESSPPGKELTLFLQYKSKIKKFVLNEGFPGLTMARLQLAFIEKFAWNTHNNGLDLPEIYVQDPVSGVRHELEDLADVKDRSVLVLNVEVLDEVKKHFDESIGDLRSTLEGVRSLLDGQGSMFQRFSDRQLETSKEMARLSTVQMPVPRSGRTRALDTSPMGTAASSESAISELHNLRRDIAVLRQTYSAMSTDFAATMTDIKAKAAVVKEAANAAVAPTYEGDAGRSHVNTGKKQLGSESEALVNRVDDLTDVVEELRKDVVTRGVRPIPRQLEDISKEITSTARDLVKMKEFLKREKPIWTKIWEKELDQVCTERDDLTQQEELVADLDGDLQDVTGVFKLVEAAMKQQTLTANVSGNGRNASKQFDYDPSLDPRAAKDGMLDEVRALKPNHEGRLEAIERAERARQKELESRAEGEFSREVKEFVEEGKLKKTGGMDEVERLRKVKDERAMKENWERQLAREAELEKKRQEKAAAKAAAEAVAKEKEKEDLAVGELAQAPISTTPTPNPTTSQRISEDSARPIEAESTLLATTMSPNNQPHDETSSQKGSLELSSMDLDKNHENGPPLLPEGNFGNEQHGKDEAEVRKSESEDSKAASKAASKDSSWWKPAIF